MSKEAKQTGLLTILRASLRWHLSALTPLVKPPGSRLRNVRDSRSKRIFSKPLRPTWIK